MIVDEIVNVYKPVGLTPFQMVERLKLKIPEYEKSKIGYAGRLDPLAHGVLLLMVGEACKRRDQYQNLPKIYQFDLLLGIKTDTFDLMGILEDQIVPHSVDSEHLEKVLENFVGEIEQEYPPFSSFHINGVPMHKLAKDGLLTKYELPKKKVTINSIKIISSKSVQLNELLLNAIQVIKNIHGEFRQEKIIQQWEGKINIDLDVKIFRIEVKASTGTYIRSIADSVGKIIGVGGIASDIYRTQVGEYKVESSIRLDQ